MFSIDPLIPLALAALLLLALPPTRPMFDGMLAGVTAVPPPLQEASVPERRLAGIAD